MSLGPRERDKHLLHLGPGLKKFKYPWCKLILGITFNVLDKKKRQSLPQPAAESSSLPSGQSLSPSQSQRLGTQAYEPGQLNSPGAHVTEPVGRNRSICTTFKCQRASKVQKAHYLKYRGNMCCFFQLQREQIGNIGQGDCASIKGICV